MKKRRSMEEDKLDVDELINDLTHVFGTDRVFYIDENTDFTKLPNPFTKSIKGKAETKKEKDGN